MTEKTRLTKACPHCGGSGLIALGERQYDDCEACLSPEEKTSQATRCGCRGQDDYCPCQNAPDALTRAARLTPAGLSLLGEGE